MLLCGLLFSLWRNRVCLKVKSELGFFVFFLIFLEGRKEKDKKNSICHLVLLWLTQWLGPWPLSRPPNLAMNKMEEMKGTFPRVWQLRQILRRQSCVVPAHMRGPCFLLPSRMRQPGLHKLAILFGQTSTAHPLFTENLNPRPWRGPGGVSF